MGFLEPQKEKSGQQSDGAGTEHSQTAPPVLLPRGYAITCRADSPQNSPILSRVLPCSSVSSSTPRGAQDEALWEPRENHGQILHHSDPHFLIQTVFQWNFSRQLSYIPTTTNRLSQVFVWDVLAQFHGSQWCCPDLQHEFGALFPQLCAEFKLQSCFGLMYIGERALVVSFAGVSQDLFPPIISGHLCLSFAVQSVTKPFMSQAYVAP